jgi:ABC-type branched-subunit amino acid transport system substrate-binding protein
MNSTSRLSLISVVLTAVFVTANHLFTIGAGAFMLGATLIALAAGFLGWLAATHSRVAFIGYLLVSLWIVVGFGLIKGLWDTTLPLFVGTLLASLSSSFPKPQLGPYAFEASGILMFVGSLFVLRYGLAMIGERHAEAPGTRNVPSTWRTQAAPAALGLVAVIAAAGAYAYSDEDRWVAPRDGIVKIGVIVPTEGPYAILGTSFVKAVEMARDDLRNTRYRYELVIRDSGPDPAQAAAVIRRVIREDQVNAIVGGVSLIGQVTKPMAAAARIPQTCVCTVSSIGDGSYNFTNIPSPEAEATRWVAEATKRGIARIAIVAQDYPSINNHVRALKSEVARVGLQITYERRFPDSVNDFREIIAQAQASGPDVFYVEALHPDLERLGQQLADAKIRNIASVVAPSLSTQPGLFEGVWYTDSNLRDIGFRKRFEDKYPGIQFATHMMPYAYDSFNMIVAAFERGENPAVYLRDLRSYDGTADRLVKAPGSGNFQSTPTVWMIKNGKPTLLD